MSTLSLLLFPVLFLSAAYALSVSTEPTPDASDSPLPDIPNFVNKKKIGVCSRPNVIPFAKCFCRLVFLDRLVVSDQPFYEAFCLQVFAGKTKKFLKRKRSCKLFLNKKGTSVKLRRLVKLGNTIVNTCLMDGLPRINVVSFQK